MSCNPPSVKVFLALFSHVFHLGIAIPWNPRLSICAGYYTGLVEFEFLHIINGNNCTYLSSIFGIISFIILDFSYLSPIFGKACPFVTFSIQLIFKILHWYLTSDNFSVTFLLIDVYVSIVYRYEKLSLHIRDNFRLLEVNLASEMISTFLRKFIENLQWCNLQHNIDWICIFYIVYVSIQINKKQLKN